MATTTLDLKRWIADSIKNAGLSDIDIACVLMNLAGEYLAKAKTELIELEQKVVCGLMQQGPIKPD